MYSWEYVRGLTDQEVRLEYIDPGDGRNHLRYDGVAKQGVPTSSPSWVIRRFDWAPGPVTGDFVVVRIQALIGAWDSRATLPWEP